MIIDPGMLPLSGGRTSLPKALEQVTDPRARRGIRHSIASTLAMVVAAGLSGAGRSFRSAGDFAADLPQDALARQLTFDYLDVVTGEVPRGRIAPADREHLRAWLARFAGRDGVHFVLEGCTGWRYVSEELAAAGITPHLAEPADTAALRGKKRHATTDKADARHLRVHLAAGDLPESWIPPVHVLEARAMARLYKDLLDERGGWHQRVAATLFHEGASARGSVCTATGRAAAAQATCRRPGGRQWRRGCGRSTGSPPNWTRCAVSWPCCPAASRAAPRCGLPSSASARSPRWRSGPIWATCAGAATPMTSSGTPGWISPPTPLTASAAGHLARQGPPLLRWALYEAAKCAARPAVPDHGYYTAARDRRTAGLATLSVARKLARRCYHTLRDLGEEAMAPAA